MRIIKYGVFTTPRFRNFLSFSLNKYSFASNHQSKQKLFGPLSAVIMLPAKWSQLLGSVMACAMFSIGKSQTTSRRPQPPGTLSLPIRYYADNHWYCSIWVSAELGDPPQAIDFGVVTNEYITVPYTGICQSNPEACRYGSCESNDPCSPCYFGLSHCLADSRGPYVLEMTHPNHPVNRSSGAAN